MEKLRVGVIGAGFIGKQHIEAIRRIPGAEVLAVADQNEELAASCARALDIPEHFAFYQDLLADDRIDVVHNCTPSAMHYPINKQVIAAGKHIYCEKPLTLTCAEAEELCGLARDAGVAAGVNFNYRHNAMVQEMRARVRSGYTGRPLLVTAEYLQDWLMFDTDFDWRIDPALGGESRAVADIGSHCFDTAQFVLGKRITRLYAKLMTMHMTRKRCEGGGTHTPGSGKVLEEVQVHNEDAAFILAEFEEGVQALFQVSQVSAGKKNGLRINVSGAARALEWDQERPDRLWIGERDAPNGELYCAPQFLTGDAKAYASLPGGHPVGWADALKNAIASFYTGIRLKSWAEPGDKPYADFEHGLSILRLVDACLESNQENCWIRMEE